MVYLSANGEVLGQFEENELPGLIASGRFPAESYFWREGMPDWRPLGELPPLRQSREFSPLPKLKLNPQTPAKVAVKRPQPSGPVISVQQPSPKPSSAPEKTEAHTEHTATAAEPVAKPASAALAPLRSRPAERAASAPLVSARLHDVAPEAVPEHLSTANAPRRRGRWLLGVSLLLVVVALAAGAVWWLYPQEPPAFEGEVRWAEAGGAWQPVPGVAVLLVAREELLATWRGQWTQARNRTEQLETLLQDSRALHRERQLAYELAAREAELAEEYNMPEAPRLRTASEAAQAEEAVALAEVENHTREIESLASPAVVLREKPVALEEAQTDETGRFRLVLPSDTAGLSLLVLAEPPTDDDGQIRAWLVALEGHDPSRAGVRQLTPENVLAPGDLLDLAGAAGSGS